MSSLGTLKKLVEQIANDRNHTLKWEKPYHGEYNSIQMGVCTKCHKWVQICTKPYPNGIEIGGPAVAVNCYTKEEKEEKDENKG